MRHAYSMPVWSIVLVALFAVGCGDDEPSTDSVTAPTDDTAGSTTPDTTGTDATTGTGGTDTTTGTGGTTPDTTAGTTGDTAGDTTGGTTGDDPSLVPDPNPGSPAECGTANVAPGSDPLLVRWPYLGNVTPNSIVISFATDIPKTDSNGTTIDPATIPVPKATVKVTRTGSYERTFNSKSDVTPGEFVGFFHMHETQITGLKPATEYCYKVFSDDKELAGGIKFRTPPAGPEGKVRFVMIGDYGSGLTSQTKVRDQITAKYKSDGFDLLLTTGDNAYGDGQYGQYQKFVFRPYQEILVSVPFYITHGNHDYKTEQAAPALKLFNLPTNAWQEADKERYYSFDWGPLHFVGLDSETPFSQMVLDRATAAIDPSVKQNEKDMEDWLRDDLSKTTRPFRIVAWHRPAYSNTKDRTPDLSMQTYIQPILQEYGVQAVFVGHNHLYERYKPVRVDTLPDDKFKGLGTYEASKESTTAAGGVVHITTAGGGSGLYSQDDKRIDSLQAFNKRIHHFVYGVAEGCTLKLEAIDLEGEKFDEITIDRCAGK